MEYRISTAKTTTKKEHENPPTATTSSWDNRWPIDWVSSSSPLEHASTYSLSAQKMEPIILGLVSRYILKLRNCLSSSRSVRIMCSLIVGLSVAFLTRSFINATDSELTSVLSNRRHSSRKIEGFQHELQRLHLSLSTLADDVTPPNKESDEPGEIFDENRTTLRGGTIGDDQYNATERYSNLDYNQYHILKHKVQELTESAENLKAQIQGSSRRQVEKKYGHEKHLVELELAFPPPDDNENDNAPPVRGADNFVIELAPLDTMPHSVHIFLEMVSAGLLDGCSFILNALHLVKAAPLPYDGSSAAEKAMSFMERGLESVSFKEYNESYPHKPYTVGFSADGSPGFYINTEDNSDIYVGEPCFGTIVSGFAAVRRMQESPTRSGIWLEKRIGIKCAKIL